MTNTWTYSPTTGYWTITPGLAGCGTALPSNSGLAVATFATPPNQTGNGTATLTMQGLGGYWKITPLQTGRVAIRITGQMVNGTTADGVKIQMAYGTGTAPTNAATVTGTVVGSTLTWTAFTGLLAQGVPFHMYAIITGLTVGTAYWFDLQLSDVTGGTASVLNLTAIAEEMW